MDEWWANVDAKTDYDENELRNTINANETMVQEQTTIKNDTEVARERGETGEFLMK